ncbi:MAG: hypothetical protein FWE83_01685 [Oscillospiraceae bacterium]|nr:hypothetical protein [Oscillospiraceae bacterium]
MLGMKGLLNAQMNLNLASKVQHSANMTSSDGRILERQGITDQNEKAIEKGRELQAKGEEIRSGVFEYLDKANENITAAAEEGKEAVKELREIVNERIEAARENRDAEASDENNVQNPIGIHGYAPGEFNVVVSDTTGGKENAGTSDFFQGKGINLNDTV